LEAVSEPFLASATPQRSCRIVREGGPILQLRCGMALVLDSFKTKMNIQDRGRPMHYNRASRFRRAHMEEELMVPAVGPFVFSDLSAMATGPTMKWEPFAPGIEIVRLYDTPGAAASAFLRYAPGAKLRRHLHRGWEHILVLSGSQSDDAGHHRTGAMLIHPPGSSHAVASEEGCIVLAIWEKPVTFVESESEPQPSMSTVS
jgi:quercetin dioxygenase-like cupin family protein